MIKKGCESCRRRHVKCSLSEGASVCDRCADLGQECVLTPPFRFCHVRYVYDNNRSKYNFAWNRNQTWPEIINPVSFVVETLGQSSSEWTVNSLGDDVAWSAPIETFHQRTLNETSPSTCYSPSIGQGNDEPQRQVACGSATPGDHPMLDMGVSPATASTASVHTRQGYADYDGNTAAIQKPHSQSLSETHTFGLTAREAFLIQSYTRKIAPWMDVCDPLSHFGNEVPRRALDSPMVMYAILALSSRHQAMMAGTTDEELEENTYHGRCLELLIPALSLPEDTYDDNLLATIILLRQHEEFENRKDRKYHLSGFIKILNMMSKFSSSRPLADAASWLSLRQAIYVSLVQREPWQLRLENYQLSQAFRGRDDSSFANMAVFLLARALQLVSLQSTNDAPPPDRQEWDSLESDAFKWKTNAPSSFMPLRYCEADPENGRPLPEVWMISGATAVGLQYYYATLLVLKIHKPQPSVTSVFESAKIARSGQIAAVKYLLDIIGLAATNEAIDNAKFTASHLICCYGYCLSVASQRHGTVSFLQHVEESMGWRVSWVIEDLTRQWREMDGLEYGL